MVPQGARARLSEAMLAHSFIPAEAAGSRWLMMVLHGLGDSSEGFRWLPEALRLTWVNFLLVDAPDPYYSGFSWYNFSGDAAPGILRSRQAVEHLMEEQARKGFPAGQTFLSGFSQGSLMTLETGLRYPKLLAGLIGISGYIWDLPALIKDLSPVAKQQRILMTHGRRDPMIPVGPVRQQAQEMKATGLQIEWHEFDKGHTIAGEPELRVIRDFMTSARNHHAPDYKT